MRAKPRFGVYTHPGYQEHYDALADAEEKGEYEGKLPLTKRGGFYGNTLLLTSLSYGDVGIALMLVQQAEKLAPKVFGMHVTFEGSRSTPLILAAKTGNTPVALAMVASRLIKDFINEVDHFGNSAMHYACLMRNMMLVDALYETGADFNIRNKFGKTPEHYLMCELDDEGLTYRYGEYGEGANAFLRKESDFGFNFEYGSGYLGTRDGNFTSYRWFIQLIVLNLHLVKGSDALTGARADHAIWVLDRAYVGSARLEKQDDDLLKPMLERRAKTRMPLMDARVYKQCCRLFTEYHHNMREQAQGFCQQSIGMDSPPVMHEEYFMSGVTTSI